MSQTIVHEAFDKWILVQKFWFGRRNRGRDGSIECERIGRARLSVMNIRQISSLALKIAITRHQAVTRKGKKKSRARARNTDTIHANRQVQAVEPVPETVARLGFAFTRLLTRCNAWEKFSISLSGNGEEWRSRGWSRFSQIWPDLAEQSFYFLWWWLLLLGMEFHIGDDLLVSTYRNLENKVIVSLSKVAGCDLVLFHLHVVVIINKNKDSNRSRIISHWQ